MPFLCPIFKTTDLFALPTSCPEQAGSAGYSAVNAFIG